MEAYPQTIPFQAIQYLFLVFEIPKDLTGVRMVRLLLPTTVQVAFQMKEVEQITSGKKEAASSKIERMKKEIDSMNSKHPSFVQTTPYKSYHTSLEQVSINDVSLSPNKPVKPIEVIQPL